MSPIAANVTNTVALTATGVGSTLGARPELAGQRERVTQLGVTAMVGGLAGALLLLATPAGAFERAVPILIGLASLAVLARPSPHRTAPHGRRDTVLLIAGMFLAAVYGGYFGAAAGVMMLAVLTMTTSDTLARSIAVKNFVLFAANVTSAVTFALTAPVQWAAALPLALGFFVGGRVGPYFVRRTPARPLRLLIALAGLAVASKLALDTYR